VTRPSPDGVIGLVKAPTAAVVSQDISAREHPLAYMKRTRRRFLGSCALVGAGAGAGCASPPGAGDSPTDDPAGTPTTWTNDFDHADRAALSLEPVASGLTSPTNLVVAPDGSGRYVIDQVGTMHAIGADGLASEPYLDLSERVVVSPERGLLGAAFHPDYPADDRLFLRYSVPRREGTPRDYTHTELLTELAAPPEAGPRLDTEQTLIEFPSPTIYHQAGTIVFGPDGYLYVAMGEGTERAFAQDVRSNRLGAIHRIDVDGGGPDRPYGIPDDNPFAGDGSDAYPEYYAWGFRNPWRMSFNDGDLVVGDVGNYSWEEIDVVEKGGNYGWPYREGAHCTGWGDSDPDAEHCGVDPASVPGEGFTDPVVEFPHDAGDVPYGTAVIAGYVYGREDVPALTGRYLFSNYTASLESPSGHLYAADPTAEGQWPVEKLLVGNSPDGDLNRVVNSLGRDELGRLYVLTVGLPDKANRFDAGAGAVYRVVPTGSASAPLSPPS
jgi:glucose/arabinose dehydrogenase